MEDRILKRRNAGFNIIEVMVSMTVGLILMAGVTSMYGSMMRGNASAVKNATLSQELRALMEFMTREIRQAGFWGAAAQNADDLSQLANNPFGIAAVNASCVQYSWDKNANGTLNREERLGFRRSSGELQWRNPGYNANSFPGCGSNNGWLAISDPAAVTVTGLSFTLTESCINLTQDRQECSSVSANPGDIEVTTQEIAISLSGELTNDSSVNLTLSENVLVRNHKL